jgi:hypothetical protein
LPQAVPKGLRVKAEFLGLKDVLHHPIEIFQLAPLLAADQASFQMRANGVSSGTG